MIQQCACNEHDFEFNLVDSEVKCPVCGRLYEVYMDADDHGNFYYELIPIEETAIA